MKVFSSKKVSRRFLVAASAYRRQVRDRQLDFSLDAMLEQYQFESSGGKEPDASRNGYTCGKWVLDATLKQMRQDHQEGLFTKYELMRGSSAFVRRAVRSWPAQKLFAYGESNG